MLIFISIYLFIDNFVQVNNEQVLLLIVIFYISKYFNDGMRFYDFVVIETFKFLMIV